MKILCTFKKHAGLLSSLGNVPLTDNASESAEEFIVKLYYIFGIKTCDAARHALFGKVSLRRLPPKSDAVRFHIMRAHYQTAIWEMANITDMELPAATESGWHLDGNVLIPVLTTLQPIPRAYTAFVTCSCKKNACRTTNADASKLRFPVLTYVRVAMIVLILTVISPKMKTTSRKLMTCKINPFILYYIFCAIYYINRGNIFRMK